MCAGTVLRYVASCSFTFCVTHDETRLRLAIESSLLCRRTIFFFCCLPRHWMWTRMKRMNKRARTRNCLNSVNREWCFKFFPFFHIVVAVCAPPHRHHHYIRWCVCVHILLPIYVYIHKNRLCVVRVCTRVLYIESFISLYSIVIIIHIHLLLFRRFFLLFRSCLCCYISLVGVVIIVCVLYVNLSLFYVLFSQPVVATHYVPASLRSFFFVLLNMFGVWTIWIESIQRYWCGWRAERDVRFCHEPMKVAATEIQ